MTNMKRIACAIAASCLTLMLVSCSGSGGNKYDGYYDDDIDMYEPNDYYEPVEPDYDDYAIPPPVPESTGWECYYSETYNYDWHDDVVCRNGLESHRPYLLEWMDYVTYDDIMRAAAEYEAALNAG